MHTEINVSQREAGVTGGQTSEPLVGENGLKIGLRKEISHMGSPMRSQDFKL